MSVEKLGEAKTDLKEKLDHIDATVARFSLPNDYADLRELMQIQIRAIDTLLEGKAISFPLENNSLAYQTSYSEEQAKPLIFEPHLENMTYVARHLDDSGLSDQEKEAKLAEASGELHKVDVEALKIGQYMISKHIEEIKSVRGPGSSDSGYNR